MTVALEFVALTLAVPFARAVASLIAFVLFVVARG